MIASVSFSSPPPTPCSLVAPHPGHVLLSACDSSLTAEQMGERWSLAGAMLLQAAASSKGQGVGFPPSTLTLRALGAWAGATSPPLILVDLMPWEGGEVSVTLVPALLG